MASRKFTSSSCACGAPSCDLCHPSTPKKASVGSVKIPPPPDPEARREPEATVRATMVFEVRFDQPFGPKWSVADLHERALRDAQDAAERVVAAARDKSVRMRLIRIDEAVEVLLRKDNT